uniref:Uncharacterized protein n=1 Tax=viral metagenome TaxID=1070528 RepID=A0A6C0F1L1_9ZZZZ
MNKLGNYFSTTATTATSFFKNTFSRGSEAAAKYLKFVYIGIFAYSAYSTYRFLRVRNKKELVKKELVKRELPEHVKYDNGWYAEFDELQKRLIMPTPPILLSEPPPAIQEVTPRGEILMYYNVNNKAFDYYSNNKNLPYRTLDAVARKYVCLHNVLSIYVDIREEVKKGTDKCSKKMKGAKDASASVDDPAKPTPASSIFAVYKNYKSGATAAVDSNGSVGNNSKKVILKDNVNKFIFKGRIDDYALDVKAREKKEKSSNKTKNEQQQKGGDNGGEQQHDDDKKEEINISYSEFKKRNVDR